MKTLKKISIVSLVFLLLIGTASCKKKQEKPPSPREILTNGVWDYYKAETYDSSGNLISASNLTGYTFDFKNNGILLYTTPSGNYQYSYAFIDDTDPMKILITDQWHTIVEFEDDAFVIKSIPDSSGEYYILSLKR
jgi:hypothetical protein